MESQFRELLGKAVNQTRDGVLEYIEPQPGDYDSLFQYEKEEMVARGIKILEAVAAYYDLANVEHMLAVLEDNRGRR